MSQADAADSKPRTTEELYRRFLDRYYADEIQALASGTDESGRLHVDVGDLDLFLDAREDLEQLVGDDPRSAANQLSDVLPRTDAAGTITPDVDVAIVDPSGMWFDSKRVADIRSEDIGSYVSVRGQLAAVTKVRSFPRVTRFVCRGCGDVASTTQDPREFREPTGTCNCETTASWEVDYQRSEWEDHRMLKIQQRPEEASNGETQHLTAHVFGSATMDKDGRPLVEHAGNDAVIYGRVEAIQQDGRGASKFLFEHYIDAAAVEIEDRGAAAVNVADHREAIEEHASADDVHERFYRSLAPQIHPTDRMELAMKLTEAYLFGAPRLDDPDGPMYRGDIHLAIIGDPGMAKSVLLAGAAEFSPDGEHRSATGLASDVGLTAAAVEDEFGEGGWSLRPGILVRAGMHAIVDEIDKGPDNLEKINDALEGKQIATIDKAGMKADLKTRTGLMVSGNPRDSRFDQMEPLSQQVDIEESLLTRFDAIVLLIDDPDEEQDRRVASHITDAYREGVQLERGETPETDTSERQVDPEVGRAWVKAGRQIVPSISEAASERLEEFYVDVRSQSETNRISATARQLESGLRLSMAYARARLSETVEPQDVDMAIEVSKAIIGQTFDGEGNFDIDKLYESAGGSTPSSQEDRIDSVRDLISEMQPRGDGGVNEEDLIDEATDRFNLRPSVVEDTLEKLLRKGELYEPTTGELRAT